MIALSFLSLDESSTPNVWDAVRVAGFSYLLKVQVAYKRLSMIAIFHIIARHLRKFNFLRILNWKTGSIPAYRVPFPTRV